MIYIVGSNMQCCTDRARAEKLFHPKEFTLVSCSVRSETLRGCRWREGDRLMFEMNGSYAKYTEDIMRDLKIMGAPV